MITLTVIKIDTSNLDYHYKNIYIEINNILHTFYVWANALSEMLVYEESSDGSVLYNKTCVVK